MKSRFEQGLLKHLAAITLAFGAGAAPAEGLREIPVRVLGEVVEGIEELDWASRDRRRLLGLLAHDSRAEVRGRVAEKAAGLWQEAPEETEQMLRQLARDPSSAVRSATAASVEKVLQNAPPIDRIKLVAEWSTSTASRDRAAIAAALRTSTPTFIEDLALEQLAADPEPAVRRLALEAAAHRFYENPAAYARMATLAAADPDRRVRRSARRILDRKRDTC